MSGAEEGTALAQASCRPGLRVPSEGLGSEGEGAGPALPLWLGPSRLDHSHLLASLPAASP